MCQHYFHLTSSEHTDTKISLEIVGEYSLYAFMWDKFGIAPKDLDQYDADWVKRMTTVASAQNNVTDQKMKASRAKSKQKSGRR